VKSLWQIISEANAPEVAVKNDKKSAKENIFMVTHNNALHASYSSEMSRFRLKNKSVD